MFKLNDVMIEEWKQNTVEESRVTLESSDQEPPDEESAVVLPPELKELLIDRVDPTPQVPLW